MRGGDVEQAHAHARRVGIVDDRADRGLGRIHPRAVILEPVGEVLHFRRTRGDLDLFITVGELDDAVTVAVVPYVISRQVDRYRGVIAGRDRLRQIDPQIGGAGLVGVFPDLGRIGVGVHRRAVGFRTRPRGINRVRVVIKLVAVVVAKDPVLVPGGETGIRAGHVRRRQDRAVGVKLGPIRMQVADAFLVRRHPVVTGQAVDHRVAGVGGGVLDHELVVHAARVVEGEEHVRLDDRRQEQRRRRQRAGGGQRALRRRRHEGGRYQGLCK